MIKNIISYIFIYIFIVGCESNSLSPDLTFLDIYLDNNKDENGYYHIEYTGTPYHSDFYQKTPNRRVVWGSEDTFSTDWMFNTFEEPIINNSTYSDDWGNGQQLFYLNGDAVGDTMLIVGYVNQIAWDYLYFIIE